MNYYKGVTLDFKAVGARIRSARKRAKYTQAELAESLGLSQPAVARMESGASALTLENLVKLQGILGRSAAYFLGYSANLTKDEQEMLSIYRRLSDAEKANVIDFAGVRQRRERSEGKQLSFIAVPPIEHIPQPAPDIPPETAAKVKALMSRLTPDERAAIIDHLMSRRDFVESLKLRGVEVHSRLPEKNQATNTHTSQE